MRSLTWSSSAKAIAALFALAVPATIVALMMSNLPLPQMTHGNILRVLTRTEDTRGLPIFLAPPLAFDFPGEGLEPLAKRFIQAFGSVGSLAFALMTLMMAAGIAASPSLLARPGTTPGVYEARKSFGWAVLVSGVVLLTLPAVAVFLRALLLDQVIGQPVDRLPAWFQSLQQAGIARVDATAPTVSFTSVSFERDAALFALPYAAGFPQVLVYLALAGALAAALAALAACPDGNGGHPVGGCGAWPAARDGSRTRPHRHRAHRAAGRRVCDRLACHCRTRRSAQAVPWSLTSAPRRHFRFLCCRSGGSASMPGGR